MTGENDYSWQRLFRVSSAELYAVTDSDRVRRNGGLLWILGSGIAALMLPFAPLDESSLGAAGWALGVAIVGAAALYGAAMFAGGERLRPGWRTILAFGYIGIAMVTVLNWLAGPDAPYEELLLIGALYVAACFPPRVMALYMVAIAAGLLLPLAWDADILVIGQVVRLLVWSALAMAVSMLLARQRLERAALLESGEEARRQARADPLTGLGNRRAFDEALKAAADRAKRTQHSLSVVVADVEDFKTINDDHGLVAGDRLLREVAAAISQSVRSPDACFRWGGDEFVILADADSDEAAAFARRLVGEIRGSCRRPDGRDVSLHVGVAELDPGTDDPVEILNAASRAMKPAPRRRG